MLLTKTINGSYTPCLCISTPAGRVVSSPLPLTHLRRDTCCPMVRYGYLFALLMVEFPLNIRSPRCRPCLLRSPPYYRRPNSFIPAVGTYSIFFNAFQGRVWPKSGTSLPARSQILLSTAIFPSTLPHPEGLTPGKPRDQIVTSVRSAYMHQPPSWDGQGQDTRLCTSCATSVNVVVGEKA